jgi:hypothetical protein
MTDTKQKQFQISIERIRVTNTNPITLEQKINLNGHEVVGDPRDILVFLKDLSSGNVVAFENGELAMDHETLHGLIEAGVGNLGSDGIFAPTKEFELAAKDLIYYIGNPQLFGPPVHVPAGESRPLSKIPYP